MWRFDFKFSSATTIPGQTRLKSSSSVTTDPSASSNTRRRSRARAQLYRHAIGDQLALAQQHLEATDSVLCRLQPNWAACVMRRRVFAVDGGLGTATRPHRGASIRLWPGIWRGLVHWSR